MTQIYGIIAFVMLVPVPGAMLAICAMGVQKRLLALIERQEHRPDLEPHLERLRQAINTPEFISTLRRLGGRWFRLFAGMLVWSLFPK